MAEARQRLPCTTCQPQPWIKLWQDLGVQNLLSLSLSLFLSFFWTRNEGPRTGSRWNTTAVSLGDTVTIDSIMTEAINQILLALVLYCTTICAPTQRSQDTKGLSKSAPSCAQPSSKPFHAIRRHSYPPFVATRSHSKHHS